MDKSKFIETWSFTLANPTKHEGMSDTEKRKHIDSLLKSAETEFRKLRSNKPPLGVKNVLRQRPTQRPLNPSFRPRIKVVCLNPARREALIDSYRSFVSGYREIFEDYSKAVAMKSRPTVEWPYGSYPPSCRHPTWHARTRRLNLSDNESSPIRFGLRPAAVPCAYSPKIPSSTVFLLSTAGNSNPNSQ